MMKVELKKELIFVAILWLVDILKSMKAGERGKVLDESLKTAIMPYPALQRGVKEKTIINQGFSPKIIHHGIYKNLDPHSLDH